MSETARQQAIRVEQMGRIVKMIESRGQATQSELAGELGINMSSAWGWLHRLVAEGKIHRMEATRISDRGQPMTLYAPGPSGAEEADGFAPLAAAMDAMVRVRT